MTGRLCCLSLHAFLEFGFLAGLEIAPLTTVFCEVVGEHCTGEGEQAGYAMALLSISEWTGSAVQVLFTEHAQILAAPSQSSRPSEVPKRVGSITFQMAKMVRPYIHCVAIDR